MDWRAELRRWALRIDEGDHTLVYHAGLRAAVPPEYDVDGLVALTFRLRPRDHGGHEFVTTIDLRAALRLGARIGLDEAASLAMVDSHERVHVAVQLAGAEEADEEGQVTLVDAVWLSLRHPWVEPFLRVGEAGLVQRLDPAFWEALGDKASRAGAP